MKKLRLFRIKTGVIGVAIILAEYFYPKNRNIGSVLNVIGENSRQGAVFGYEFLTVVYNMD